MRIRRRHPDDVDGSGSAEPREAHHPEEFVVGIDVAPSGTITYRTVDEEVEVVYDSVDRGDIEILDDRVPSNWVPQINELGHLAIHPAAWQTARFWATVQGSVELDLLLAEDPSAHPDDVPLAEGLPGAWRVFYLEVDLMEQDPGSPDPALWELIARYRQDPGSVEIPGIDGLARYTEVLADWVETHQEFECAVTLCLGTGTGNHGYAAVRRIRFRVDPDDGVFYSDAVVAVDHTPGSAVAARSLRIAAPFGPEEKLRAWAHQALPARDWQTPRIIGWADRPDIGFRGDFRVTADARDCDEDFVSGSRRH